MSFPIALTAVTSRTQSNPSYRDERGSAKLAEPAGRKLVEGTASLSISGQKQEVDGAADSGMKSRVGMEVVEVSSRGRKLAGLATGTFATDPLEATVAKPEGAIATSEDATAKPDSAPVKPEDWFRLYNANRSEEKAGPKSDQSVFASKSSGSDGLGENEVKGVLDAPSSGDDAKGASDVKNVFDTSTARDKNATSVEGQSGEPKSSVQNKTPGSAPLRKAPGSTASEELTEQERQEVRKLEMRDREVRIHEQAHKAVGGGLAGPVDLSLEHGPDGKSYAVNGSVSIDVSSVKGDPEATLVKMRRVQAAAMAPVNPSGADQQIAARAAARLAEALQDVARKRFEAMQSPSENETSPGLSLTA